MFQHVAVLMGGWSAEREVSLISGAACAEALLGSGFDVTRIDIQQNVHEIMNQLKPKPDVIFNALHGRYGEDGCVQGLLNILGIPYTHSGLLASALAMDKPVAKKLFEAAGIPVAGHQIKEKQDFLSGNVMAAPYVVKPVNEGSSVGVHIISEGCNGPPFTSSNWPFGDLVMVEKYIAGRELTVAVLEDRALAVTEIIIPQGFYDYDAKYLDGKSTHIIPADIPESLSAEIMNYAVLAHKVLGCRGITRADFRYDDDKTYILEVNTQPGMTPTSLLPEQAAYVGISFEDLVVWMIEHAECDT